MSPPSIPPSSIDLAALPPWIMTSEPGSFAQGTFRVRIPAIVREIIALNDFPAQIRGALEMLHAELIGGSIRGLREDAPDRPFWDAAVAPHLGSSWLAVPWYWAEAYFYRRVLEATRYFQPGVWVGFDPYRAKKLLEWAPAAAPAAAAALLEGVPSEPEAAFEHLVHASLWGNRTDLSYEIAAHLGGTADPRHDRANLLVDDTPRLWRYIAADRRRRLAILADNAGTELLADLALVDFLLASELVDETTLYLKPQPFFVSDTMPDDVGDGLAALARRGGAAEGLSRRMRGYLDDGSVRLHTNWHSVTSLFYFEMPEDLRLDLAGMDLVLLKGDVNYRRLLGDVHWPPVTSFADATAYFPAPLAALRTMKGELVVGLGPGVAEGLDAEDPAWMVNGRRGLVQARF